MEKGSANSAPVLRSAFASCDSGVALRKSQITTERIYNQHKPLVQDPLPSPSVNLHAMFVGIKFKRSISPFYFQSTKNLSSTFKSKKNTPRPSQKSALYRPFGSTPRRDGVAFFLRVRRMFKLWNLEGCELGPCSNDVFCEETLPNYGDKKAGKNRKKS